MTKTRLVLADDHALVLAGMCDLLAGNAGFEVAAAVTSPTALVQHMSDDPPDVAITDYSMPGDDTYGDGIRLVKYLVRHFAQTRVVVLTMVSNPMIISALYDVGVAAVVLKQDDLTEILTALREIGAGRKYYPPGFQSDDTIDERTRFIGERINSISPKEFEVLRHFIRGASVMEVADTLKRSVKTVSGQKMAAMRKLNVRTDQELIAFCLESGFFQ